MYLVSVLYCIVLCYVMLCYVVLCCAVLCCVAGGETLRWRVGEPVFFDDCYEHSVWNNTSDDRVVLLFDMW
jgi:aspartyl/asparaginyl beta-hydroxylase (cupin superfamily)